jgi:hypothetical protein
MFKAHFPALWEPAISALLAAHYGDTAAAAALDQYLASWTGSPDWVSLTDVLGRIKAGDRYDPNLMAGLDEADTAIATRALDVIAERATAPVALGPAMMFGDLLGDLVFAAAQGDAMIAERARRNISIMARDRDRAALAGVLSRILDGDRAPGLSSGFVDPLDRVVVETVLRYIPLSQAERP